MTKASSIIVGVIIVAGIAGAISYAIPRNCVGRQTLELLSPTKAFSAILEENNCSEQHEWQFVVKIYADSAAAGWVYVASSPASVKWLGEATLEIEYPRGTKVDSRRESIGNVKLVYKEKDSQP